MQRVARCPATRVAGHHTYVMQHRSSTTAELEDNQVSTLTVDAGEGSSSVHLCSGTGMRVQRSSLHAGTLHQSTSLSSGCAVSSP